MELLGRGPSDFEGYIAEILWLRLKASVTALPRPSLPSSVVLCPSSVCRLPFAVFLLPSPLSRTVCGSRDGRYGVLRSMCEEGRKERRRRKGIVA